MSSGSKSMMEDSSKKTKMGSKDEEEVWSSQSHSQWQKPKLAIFVRDDAYGWTNRLERYFV